MTTNDIRLWLEIKYPVTIIADRYGGTYSGARFVAFPLDYYDVPEDAAGDDVSCMLFWDNYAEPVGKGASPQAAHDNLVARMQALLSIRSQP